MPLRLPKAWKASRIKDKYDRKQDDGNALTLIKDNVDEERPWRLYVRLWCGGTTTVQKVKTAAPLLKLAKRITSDNWRKKV